MSGANKFNLTTIKFLITLVLSVIGISACNSTPSITTSEKLVNAAITTLNILKNRSDLENFNSQLQAAAGIAIFPSVYKAGFFAGAEGGNGVVINKRSDGVWGYPAFYTLASGSWGLQFGGQKSGVVFIIRKAGAVESLLQHQGKLSAGMNVSIGKIGTGIEGGVTTNLGPDIIAYSDSQGLFSGVALKGSAMIRRNDLNAEYYGGQVEPRAIVIKHAHQNPQADELRKTLSQ